MYVVAWLVKEDLEVAHDGVGSLPTAPDSAQFRDLDPSLARSPHSMVDIDTKRQLGWKEKERGERGRWVTLASSIGLCNACRYNTYWMQVYFVCCLSIHLISIASEASLPGNLTFLILHMILNTGAKNQLLVFVCQSVFDSFL